MNKKNKVDISVLITNYNHAHFLPECLDAVFSQSASPLEVIVIDDASTDESISLLKRYKIKHPELIILHSQVNQGPAKAMNDLIHFAKGKYLVLAAADDKVLPGFFELGTAYFDHFPEAGICCSNISMFKNEKPYRIWEAPAICCERKAIFIPPSAMVKRILRSPFWIPTNASLYRKDLVVKYGCLDEELKHLCDWFLNYKIALNHGVIYVPHSFGAFRLSMQSYGAKWNRSVWKKIPLYQKLFSLLSQETTSFQKTFCKAGVLGLITADVFFYLLFHISLWKYIPFGFYRKTCNFFRKFSLKKRLFQNR